MGVRPWLPLLVWFAGLVLGTWFFHGLGQGELAAPPLDPAGWAAWAATREPAVAVIAVLRLVALGLCWYLVGITTIGLSGRLLRAARMVRYADALTLPWVRRLLQQGLGLALATAMVTGAAGASSASTSRAQSAVVGAGTAVTLSSTAGPPTDVDPPAVATDGARQLLPLPLRLLAPSAVDDATATEMTPVRVHTVRAGDSLWRIAAQELAGALDRAPTDAEVVPYWRMVIEQNRAGLPDPDDPDLILPGQRVELPPVPEG